MANTFSHNRWLLDTVNASFVTTAPIFIHSIQWEGTGLTAGTDEATLTDDNDKFIIKLRAKDAVVSEHYLINTWFHSGFKLPVLDGGTLIVTVG